MSRRRRTVRHTRRGNFITRNSGTIIIAVVVIILIIVVTKFALPMASKFLNNSNQAGQLGIVKIDGSKIGVFDTKQEAENNTTTIDAGTSNIELSGSGELIAYASINGFPSSIMSEKSKGNYTLDTTELGDGITVIVKVSVGGDGSIIGQRLGGDVDTYYFAILVNNPISQDDMVNIVPTISETQSDDSSIPNGIVYIDGTSFDTYGSEWDAQSAISGQQQHYTLPRYMVENGLPIRVVPITDNTERVFIQVTMVDNTNRGDYSVCANPQTNWEATLDVNQFAGHQITLMLKAEDGWALSNGYSYISFFLPEMENTSDFVSISTE